VRIAEFAHRHYVADRRARVLSFHVADLIPRDARVLDIGCGDGLVAHRIMRLRPDLSVRGIDVRVRDKTWIPVELFDGRSLPYGNASVDTVLFLDVLHHVEDALGLLREGLRVSRHTVLIKDHILEGFLAGPTLRFMDRTGNLRQGVPVRYEYWRRQRWLQVFESLKVRVTWKQSLGLYPWPAQWVFERRLHFIASLEADPAQKLGDGLNALRNPL